MSTKKILGAVLLFAFLVGLGTLLVTPIMVLSQPSGGPGVTNPTWVYQLNVNDEYTLPTVDGTADQILTTNGSGTVSWSNNAPGFSDPMINPGDLIYKNAGGTTTRLPVGTDNYVLTVDGTDIGWEASAGGGGGAPTDATYITQTADATLSAEQALGVLSTGILKSTTTTGIISIATASDLPIVDGGGIMTGTEVETALQENRTAINLNTTHRSSDGSNHTFIDQDVTSGSSPTFDGTNITGLDISDSTNLAVSSPISLTGDTIGYDTTANVTLTGNYDFRPNNTGANDAYDIEIGTAGSYGGLVIGNTEIYSSSFSASNLDLDKAMLFRQYGNLGVGNDPGIEFAWMEQGNTVRMAIPESGADNATAFIRSGTFAGPYSSTIGNNIVSCDQWTAYDSNIDCDTGGTGADLFVQDDLEVEGEIFLSGTNILHFDADDASSVQLTSANATGVRTVTLRDASGTVLISGDTLTGDVTATLDTDGSTVSTIATGAVDSDELASTAVTPGSYTSTDLTVDADGRITAASNGSGGSAENYILIRDKKAQNTDGGTFTLGAWRTRDLNEKLYDADGDASITKITFTSGSDEPSVGDTVSGQTSGATGVVFDVVIDSGSWVGNDADGEFWLNTVSGTFQAETLDNDTTTDTDIATGDGAQTQNQIRLNAGTYHVHATAPAHKVARHQARLYNITDTSEELLGSSSYEYDTNGSQNRGIIIGRFTIAANKTVEVQHQCQLTRATDGYGYAANFGDEIYTVVKLKKEGTISGGTPLTTKGDLYTYSTENTRLGIGSNGQVLTIDTNEATGLKWADEASSGRWTLESGAIADQDADTMRITTTDDCDTNYAIGTPLRYSDDQSTYYYGIVVGCTDNGATLDVDLDGYALSASNDTYFEYGIPEVLRTIQLIGVGNCSVSDEWFPKYLWSERDAELVRIYLEVDTAPTGAALEGNVEINTANGLSAEFSIAASGTSTDSGTTIDATAADRTIEIDEFIEIDISQCGSTIPGGNVAWAKLVFVIP